MRRALLLAAALAVLGPVAASRAEETGGPEWPFGVPPGDRVSQRKRDLYNFGPLGAKARDADKAEVTFEGGGRRQVQMTDDGGRADDGPDRLRVELLYPDGPASRAGLHVGDVVTGVNGRKFKDGSLQPLAKAVTDAESGKVKGGIVRLTVERAGQAGPLTLDVAIPVVGKEAEKPVAPGKFRDRLVADAAAWLAKRQDDDGGFPQTLSGENGAVVQTSLAGLVWLSTGSDLKQGPYAERLRRAADFVALVAGKDSMPGPSGGANWSQVNWGLAHAGIFLGELVARTPDDATYTEPLRRIATEVATNQEKTGGWAHGPGGPNALGYVELNIVTGISMAAMGLAKRVGYEPPADVLKRTEDYLVASGSGDGGVAYSAQPGQAGQGNIGRTAGAWLGAVTLGQKNAPYAKKMEGYVRSHAGEIFSGHASLMQHFLLAGVAAHSQGGEALASYWKVCERDMTLARTPDGSFQPRPWHESVSMGSNSDVSFGDVWTTAAWAVVLGCEPVKGGRPGLPAWTGRLPPPLPPKKK